MAKINWTEYSSEKENFKIIFPGKVKRLFQSFTGHDDGISSGTAVYICNIKRLFSSTIYQVGVTRVAEYFGTSQEFLSTALNELIKSINQAILRDKRSSTFKKFPAINYTLEIKKAYRLVGVIFLVENSIYNLTVLFASKSKKEPEESNFFNSFEVLNHP